MLNEFKAGESKLITAINERKTLDELWSLCLELKNSYPLARSVILEDVVTSASSGLLSVEPEYSHTIAALLDHLRGNCLSRTSLKDTDDDVIKFIEQLVERYKYKKLPKAMSQYAQKIYEATIPSWCALDGEEGVRLATKDGTVIANGYCRLVVGDYGAFIEYNREQAIRDVVKCKSGEEYRFKDPLFKDKVKYYWYTANDSSDVKIYFQQKKVTYADYQPQMFYASPFELFPVV